MAIGAVVLSLPVALLSSVYMSALHGLMLWQGFAAYTLVGFVVLLAIFVATAIESANHAKGTAQSHGA